MVRYDQLAETISQIMEENKALDIKTMSVTHLTDITDTMIICTATSDRHSKNIADKIITQLKDSGIKPYGTNGKDSGQWILLDYTDVVAHIMLEDERSFYDLERLWSVTKTAREHTK